MSHSRPPPPEDAATPRDRAGPLPARPSLWGQLAERQAELDRLRRLAVRFPYLREQTDRFRTTRLCAPEASAAASGHELRRSCDCCDDAPLHAWIFVDTPDGRVHADPPCHRVALLDEDAGVYVHEEGGFAAMLAAGVPGALVARVSAAVDAWLRAHNPAPDGAEEETLP